ncbi:ester cyclase [Psychrobium sp. MM17-31]|uniref:ester cyclase n=1 Tax=Psychrobium sp. MM17-31 TaxID=2917758 RepID=UPI001EF44A41|nr:ester cyclase [Psychrobium sp. MM17-31]MCG7533186.1 ester cyclase [Psychrobium sp. MM17-31]
MSIINNFYQALRHNGDVAQFAQSDMKLHVSHPLNDIEGLDNVKTDYWSVLSQSLPDIERKAFIEFDSEYQGQQWVAATGYFTGTFSQSLLDIPATGKSLYLRFTELVQLTDGKIADYYIILDFLDVMNQAGVNPLRKSLGHDGLIMPPTTMDGLAPLEQDASEADVTEKLVMDMLDELGRFDGKSLTSMKLEDYWHSDFMWYGPAGVGTTRGIDGFRKHHQGPFVFSFPDRVVDHKATIIKKGNYVSTGGWPHMHGSHLVGGWLGLPPCGKELELRVMDIWRREGDKLKENWVGIDIIHMCKQMGLDVFEMMKLAHNL